MDHLDSGLVGQTVIRCKQRWVVGGIVTLVSVEMTVLLAQARQRRSQT